jgi:hypothetical protein
MRCWGRAGIRRGHRSAGTAARCGIGSQRGVTRGHEQEGRGGDRRQCRHGAQAIGPAASSSSVRTNSVRTNTGEQTQNCGQAAEPAEFAYTPAERAAIDRANDALAPVIEAVDRVEDIEGWVPSLVRGVRALRDRAIRETGPVNHFDQQYRRTFGDLLNAEPIGPWLLDKHRLLDAVHYLGSDDTYLDIFMEWLRAKITDAQRKKWRALPTLVDHFKHYQNGTVPNKDRRTSDQKEIERVRTEGHKADAALLAEVEQARQELATQAIETTETLGTALRRAGPEMVIQALRDQDLKDYARTLIELASRWLNEPSP